MTRAVVILGAGSSADFGVPTLSTMFSDRYVVNYLKHKLALFNTLDELFWKPRGHTLATCDQSLNVEQMLTIIKDWEREKSIPDAQKPKNLSEFRRGLYVLIQKAVFEGKSSRPAHLNALIDICHKTFEHTTWASFNWDCIFESSFWYRIPYGLGWGTRYNPQLAIKVENWRSGTNKHLFLKLHGGINWWLINDLVTYLPFTAGGPLQAEWEAYDNDPKFADRPVILEPSLYKYTDAMYNQLAPQWDHFFQNLIKADCIIVLGYSLPEMDINARSRIMTAFQVNNTGRWLVIDPSEKVCNLYKRLLGCDHVQILEKTLASFNTDILEQLKTAFPNVTFP
jgi:hypothetical protein